jgi:hypothetical protein
MFVRSFLLAFLFSSLALAAYDVDVKVNGGNEFSVVANQLTNIKMSFTNQETGEKPHHFMKMHDKLMHMILVSDDLEHFAHIHPSFQHMKKDFSIDLNVDEAPDSDNLDTIDAIPYGGQFFVFTEVMPHTDDMAMVYSRFALQASGKARPPVKEYERIRKPGEKMVKYLTESGDKGVFGAKYKATFDFEQYQWCSWFLPKFYILIEVWDDETKSYRDPQELQKWLSMGGHSILISRDEGLENRSFYHLHALLPVTTPGEFVFPYHDHQKGMNNGNYRIFMQFKHNDRVQKLYFDFEYVNPPLPESNILGSFLFC